jgi:hypothetical protein
MPEVPMEDRESINLPKTEVYLFDLASTKGWTLVGLARLDKDATSAI